MVRGDIGGGEEAAPGADLSGPPMLVRAVRHGDNISSLKFQLSRLLRGEIVEGLDQILRKDGDKENPLIKTSHLTECDVGAT